RHDFQGSSLKNAIQAFAGLFVGRARFEPSHQMQPPETWLIRRAQAATLTPQQRLASNRNSDGRVITYLQRARERLRRHTDDSERHLVEFERLADDGGIGAEPLLPKLIAEHNHWRRARFVIFITDRTSQDR